MQGDVREKEGRALIQSCAYLALGLAFYVADRLVHRYTHKHIHEHFLNVLYKYFPLIRHK